MTSRHAFEKARGRVQVIRGWAEQTLLWKVWDRMLETEFVDRSIALAGKAFISFFPLIIVVAAFMPAHLRMSIFTTVTHRLGITGASLGHGQAGVLLRRGHPPGHRPARPGPGGLLRQLVHDRAPARLPPRLASAPPRRGAATTPGGSPGWRHSSSIWGCWAARVTS